MSNAPFLFFIFLSAYIKFQVVLMLSIIDHQLTSLCSSRIHPIDCFFLFHWLYFSFPRFLISVFILPDTILFLYIIIFSISCFCDGSFFFFYISEHPQDTYFKIFGGSHWTNCIWNEFLFLWFFFLSIKFLHMFLNFVLQPTFEWKVLCFNVFLTCPLLFPSSILQSGILLLISEILAGIVVEPEGGLALFLVLRQSFCSPTFQDPQFSLKPQS